MRAGTLRRLFFAAFLLPAPALLVGAQPPLPVPPPRKIDPEEDAASAERAKLQAELLSLLRRLSTTPPPTATPPVTLYPPKTKAPETTDAAKVDAIREGMNLFRDGNFEAARRTFQLIDPAALSREDRAFVRYMLACCLRRLGRTGEAGVIYREVANSPDDEFLANCAIWQLSLLKAEADFQLQLDQLRARVNPK
jgi:hypothetical protein